MQFLASRIAQSVFTFCAIATLLFVMLRAAPGDPTALLVDPTLPQEVQIDLRQRLGLDRSMAEQYVAYIRDLASLDFGRSFYYTRPVTDIIGDRLANTLILSLATFVIAYGLGILGGVFLAVRHGHWSEPPVLGAALLFRSAPLFWTGTVFLILFAFNLHWLPSGGMREPGYESSGPLDVYLNLDFLRHLVLPAVVSGLYFAALPMLLLRGAILETLGEDFIELARAKGLSRRTVVYRHAVRNALLPVVTTAALYLGLAAGGLVVVEVVFSWPGLGREIILSAQRNDYPLAQASFLLLAAMVLTMNIVADIVYLYLDPRVRYRTQA